ncbi:MAG: hypothetical protein KatS3mg111_3046 [Pirellulaceae bacterium]|nr:MAG: hypothetical protein KatS3mg111_3046 [Pirellulaceae bacterium]
MTGVTVHASSHSLALGLVSPRVAVDGLPNGHGLPNGSRLW